MSVFVLLAVGVGLALSHRPWEVYFDQRRATDERLADMSRAEESRTELTRQKARLDSRSGREELARSQGFRRPGEVPPEEAR